MTLHILDCTLRDGGYYNNWCFSRELVDSYLDAMGTSGIDLVEIGFRNFPQDNFLGPYAYSAESFLRTLNIPDSVTLGVMIDAKTVLNSHQSAPQAIEQLFIPATESVLGLVRIAAHFTEAEHCQPMVDTLKKMGYTVGLNLMQAAGKPAAKITELASLINDWKTVDVLYFADSFGSMDFAEVSRVTEALAAGWPGEIGIHTHNNKSMAVQNTLHAIDIGVNYLDATVLGMGRGAGNAELEILLCELMHQGVRDFDLLGLYTTSVDFFQPLKDQYQWGANFLYHYSALNNIHPMFAQSSGSDKRYSTREKFSALTSLASKESTSFSKTEMDRSFHSFRDDQPLDENTPAIALPEFNNADILLIGAGGSVGEYADDIETFIKDHTPLVLTLNHQPAIDPALVDGIICVDQYRLLYEADYLAECGKPIYTASRFQDETVQKKLSHCDLHEYDCLLQENSFSALPNGCVIPVPLAFAYALALCITGKARRLFLAGFDGFDPDDSRQHEMLKLLKIVEPYCEGVDITALTPTSYPVPQGSIYASYK